MSYIRGHNIVTRVVCLLSVVFCILKLLSTYKYIMYALNYALFLPVI
jgi:hypothetical protein